MTTSLRLDKDEREALEALQKAYIYESVELLCQSASRNRQRLSFDAIYESIQLRKAQIIRLLQNDPDFHVDLCYMVKQVNERLEMRREN